jgi:hypothetical protein
LDSNKKFRQLTKILLAGTCLTVASAKAALATTIDQSHINGGFGATFNTATLLPTGTTTVTGTVGGDVGGPEYFEIPGLTAGDIIQVTASNSEFNPQLFTYNTSQTALASTQTLGTTPDVFDIIAPGNGDVIFGMPAPIGSYSVSIADEGNAPAPVPEPAGLAELGVAVLGAASVIRRKVKQG